MALDPQFVAALKTRPTEIETTTSEEFQEICRLENAGQIAVPSMRVGIKRPHGKVNRWTRAGYTMSVRWLK